MFDKRGSVWRKWDLHVHCPTTALNNQFEGSDTDQKWEKYIDKLSEVENISVLGITDYFSIDGYMKIMEFSGDQRLANYDLILPNCELRIIPVTEQKKAINFHFIFDPKIVDELDTLFFSKLEFEYEGEPYQCKRNDLIRLGRKYKNNYSYEENAAYRVGVNQFKVGYKEISKILKGSNRLRNHCLTGVSNSSNDGNSGIQHSSLAATREEIYRLADFIFSSNPNDVSYFLGEGADSKEEVIRKYGSLKPCIHGSDAHHLENICKPDEERFTWIKSDPTFEGLLQIIYEPKYRVSIGQHSPPAPPKTVDNLTINIDRDLFVKRDSKNEREDFCIKGNFTMAFSPNLNCIIGGRGSGKSTILNLMKLKIKGLGESLYPNSEIIDQEGKSFKLSEATEILGSTSQDVEFLSQNEVEQFALNSLEFTSAIYERLKQVGDRNKLKVKSEEQSDYINQLTRSLEQQRKKNKLIDELKRKKEALKNKKQEIQILEDQEYLSLQEEINTLSKELTQLKNARKKLRDLLLEIKELNQKYEVSNPIDDFSRTTIEITSKLKEYYDNNYSDTINESERERELISELNTSRSKLTTYLSDLGYEQQNISNISSAQSEANELGAEIDKTENEIDILSNKVESISIKQNKEFETLLIPRIEELNQTLKSISETTKEVKEISLEYNFDRKKAFTDLCSAFNKNELPVFESGSSLSDKDVIVLFSEFFTEQLQLKKSVDILLILEEKKSLNKTNKVVYDYFYRNLEGHLKLLELYQLRYESDIEKYLRINLYYDGRDIESSSFGQRCTAAMVILLSMGNNPIVIDEPEAHLDSGLIAKYLVNLVKDRKQHRQVIFATHNANFVVNGDSELIHILQMDKNNLTTRKSTTIENILHRTKLYDLEGGKEAFIQREKKYNFS